MTKIISWNINGLRGTHNNDAFLPFVKKAKPDILCLQETKVEKHQLPEEVREIPGYHSFFAHSKERKGYSGVAIYSKEQPEHVEEGIGVPEFDTEGRVLVAYYKDFVLLNVYFPNGGGGPERLQYKLDFYDAFLKFIETLNKKQKYPVIFCGDVNTAHTEIDLARPKQNEKNTGFLPEERAWIDEVIAAGYTDVFRQFHPEKTEAYTYWDMKTRARDRNVGWRIDYFFVSPEVSVLVKDTKILKDIFGSDHCPIELQLK